MRSFQHELPELGQVTVAGLKMSQRFELMKEGKEAEDDTLFACHLLSVSVVGDGGQPLKTVDEWDEYGGEHFAAAMGLFSAILEFNDVNGRRAKKT